MKGDERMRRLRYLTHRHRSPSTNQALGLLLAFNAGAVNAGGFLVLQRYTSHMSGFASQVADGIVLGNLDMVLIAVGAILAFMSGAASTAILVNFSRRCHHRSIYALPLLLEAVLLLPFGMMGKFILSWHAPAVVPITVFLLSFMMGLQNATGSKSSGGSMRTTHMTGNITDLGMEIGKMLYWNREGELSRSRVTGDRKRVSCTGGLVIAFMSGGMMGAAGFKVAGFVFVVPLAVLLFMLAWIPVWLDVLRYRKSIFS